MKVLQTYSFYQTHLDQVFIVQVNGLFRSLDNLAMNILLLQKYYLMNTIHLHLQVFTLYI